MGRRFKRAPLGQMGLHLGNHLCELPHGKIVRNPERMRKALDAGQPLFLVQRAECIRMVPLIIDNRPPLDQLRRRE
jgi:hypothetical protein